jgi:uncharacterized membrane protein
MKVIRNIAGIVGLIALTTMVVFIFFCIWEGVIYPYPEIIASSLITVLICAAVRDKIENY